MKIFIWDYLSTVSSNWHAEGGLVLIHESLEAARAFAKEGNNLPSDSDAFVKDPDLTLDCSATEPEAFIFPNAGCC